MLQNIMFNMIKSILLALAVSIVFSVFVDGQPCPTGFGNTAETLAADSNKDLRGKVALVTGGRSGLGYDITKSLLQQGATVIIASRSIARNQLAVKQLKEEFGSSADISYMTFDLESFDNVRDFAEDFMDEYDRLDYLFLNAANNDPTITWIDDGTSLLPTPLTIDGYDTVFQTNYLSQLLLADELLPLMRETYTPSKIIVTGSSTYQWSCGSLGLAPEDEECFGENGGALDMLPFDDSSFSLFENSNNGCFNGPYSVSKFLLMELAKEISERESENGVTAYSWAPGNILTNENKNAQPITEDIDNVANGFPQCPYVMPCVGNQCGSTFDPRLPPSETNVPPQFGFFNSPAHGAKAAIYQALIAEYDDEDAAGSFSATYYECEPNEGYNSLGMTDTIRTEIYELSKKWIGTSGSEEEDEESKDDDEDEEEEEEDEDEDDDEDEDEDEEEVPEEDEEDDEDGEDKEEEEESEEDDEEEEDEDEDDEDDDDEELELTPFVGPGP